ncbi:DNA polymerase III [Magnetospirillum sp. UT-4]|uniref:DNA polymerase III n=1 Tax=Magnetospirillum sp. UT-4 TaxID=2681467 RepID=UPI00137DBEE3|nr:DNA polymerase III [Magnetospirillum sp. UT-4]CAA7611748.1 conserved hypothetical protein [Magnetospirillum sp. UT-4]
MSSVPPPAAPPVPLTQAGSAGAVVALALKSGSLEMPPGTTLEALATARAAKGLILAQTAAGPVQLKALPGQVLPPIPEGARLLLQTSLQGGEPQLRLLAINGRPLAGALLPGMPAVGAGTLPGLPGLLLPAGAATNAAGSPAAATPAASQAAPGVTMPGVTVPAAAAPAGITATVIRPAAAPSPPGTPAAAPPAGAATAFLPPDLPAGTQLTVRIAGVVPQAAAAAAAPAPGPAPVSPSAPAPAPAGPPVTQQAPPPATGTPPPAPISPASAPPVLSGTVIAHPPGGQAVVQTAIGTLALPTHADLAAGTALKLEVVGPPLPPPPSAPGPARPEGLTAAGWPAMDEAVRVLSAGDDRQGLETLLRTIPQAGPRLAAGLAVFAGAVQRGDTRALFGDGAARALDKAGRRDLADRVKSDLDGLAAEGGRPAGGGEWRAYTLPFMGGGPIEPVRLYVRGAGDDKRNGAGTAGNDQRFVIDFDLSCFGRLQMDGLVRREEKLFDLIIRTGEPLPERVRRDIMAIFTDSSELVGTKGSVAFQAGGRWIDLRPDEQGPTRLSV